MKLPPNEPRSECGCISRKKQPGGTIRNFKLNGRRQIAVFANPSNVQGDYQSRILPKYGEDGAAWDATTFEPNNTSATAALVEPGRTNAITASRPFKAKSISLRSVMSNVSPGLNQGFYRYTCAGGYGSYSGLALFAYDVETQATLVSRCRPNGTGGVHTTVTFTAPSTGAVTLRMFLNVPTTLGEYTLNVRLADEPAPAPDGRRIYLPLLRR